MTREEAIETLKANYPDACYEQLREAVDAAIEALKAQDGTDTNVGSNGDTRMKMDDTISRQDAIDAANDWLLDCLNVQKQDRSCGLIRRLEDLPPAQPVLDRTKISDLLEKIYSIQSVYLSAEGVIAKKYFCEELWKEMFGSGSELPAWMR